MDEPGRFISRDITKGERAEADIDAFIRKRHERRVASLEEGERAEEEAWKESVRRYDEKRRIQARYEWHLYHTSQAERHRRTLETLIAHHETRAAGLAKLGKPRLDDGPDAAA